MLRHLDIIGDRAKGQLGMNQSATIVINRPVAEVYDYVMDVPHDAKWRSNIVEAGFSSDGPLGVGLAGFDRISANGKEMVAAWTVVEFEPGKRARWKFDSGPLRGFGGYTCEPAGEGTRFTLVAQVRSTGLLRLLGPIFSMMVRRFNRTDVQKLKQILEGSP